MAQSSNIEWTNSTWNPVTGCTKISPGCQNCYAERMAIRLKAMKQPNYINGFDVTLHNHSLFLPIKWKTPQTIFVNSMSDLFHEQVPLEFILKVFDIMNTANWHTYQLLTKRSDRLRELDSQLPWAPHIWMGVSIENDIYKRRLDDLRQTNAYMKFISFEPLLGSITDLILQGIDWVIVGGESGPNARPIEQNWVTEIRDKCKDDAIPFFFKQWGGIRKKKSGRLLEGRTWDEIPRIS
jgi:protein gp37